MVLAELYKVDINIRSISVYNKQSISIVFDFRGLLYFYLLGILFKIFKLLKVHFLI